SNFVYALRENPETGTIRETFVLNQLMNAGLSVNAPAVGDFLANGITIEVGGKSKSAAQVKHLTKYLIAADNIEVGSENKVPIWLFGFLY
ncbi:MAG TPA: hypothetical protein VFS31_07035, partial [Chitinophagaceae bacterium]|nr:hypothetical protein [Chitinophagaceae bacterium]